MVEDVIQIFVLPNLFAQRFDLLFGSFHRRSHRADYKSCTKKGLACASPRPRRLHTRSSSFSASLPPFHDVSNCFWTNPASYSRFCWSSACRKPHNERGLRGVRLRSSRNVFSAPAASPFISKAAPNDSRTGKNQS